MKKKPKEVTAKSAIEAYHEASQRIYDNEIIKALEHCKRPAGKHDCENCPYVLSRGMCTTNMLNDTIDLINRQKAEIDELQLKISSCNAEIEKFHKIADRLKSANATKYSNGYQVGYTKAIKEFAERLKELSYLPNLSLTNMEVVDIAIINNLVKEMTEQSVNYESSKMTEGVKE